MLIAHTTKNKLRLYFSEVDVSGDHGVILGVPLSLEPGSTHQAP